MKDLHEIHLAEVRAAQEALDDGTARLWAIYAETVLRSRENLLQASLRRFGVMCGGVDGLRDELEIFLEKIVLPERLPPSPVQGQLEPLEPQS